MTQAKCLNPACQQPNFYGARYGGYCLDCANAGLPELLMTVTEAADCIRAMLAISKSRNSGPPWEYVLSPEDTEALKMALAALEDSCAKN